MSAASPGACAWRRRDVVRAHRASTWSRRLAREGSNMISARRACSRRRHGAAEHEHRPVNFNRDVDGDLLGAHAGARPESNNGSAHPLSAAPGRQPVASGQPAERQRLVPGRERLHGDEPEQHRQPSASPTCPPESWTFNGGFIYVTEVFTTAQADHASEQLRRHGAARCCIRSRISEVIELGVALRGTQGPFDKLRAGKRVAGGSQFFIQGRTDMTST